MAKLTKDEVIDLMDSFINEMMLYGKFTDFLEERGYSAEEVEAVTENLSL